MPFGLTNAPATFSRLMELEFLGYCGIQNVYATYLDDVMVFDIDFETALSNLSDVLQCIRRAHSKLKPKKCTLFQTSVVYLGHK